MARGSSACCKRPVKMKKTFAASTASPPRPACCCSSSFAVVMSTRENATGRQGDREIFLELHYERPIRTGAWTSLFRRISNEIPSRLPVAFPPRLPRGPQGDRALGQGEHARRLHEHTLS